MTASASRFPRTSSRTNTQAISVPNTALITETITAAPTVNRIAAAASGVVTASQNRSKPSSVARHATTLSGMSTTRLNQIIATPTPSGVPPRERAPARKGRPGTGRPFKAAVVLATGRDPDAAFDLGHDAVLRVEEPVGHLGPAAEVGDREEALGGGEVEGALDTLDDRPVAVLGEDRLRLRCPQVVQERLGLLGMLRALGHRHWVLDEDGGVRHDVVDRLVFLLSEDRLVLVGEEDVAGARGEGLQ